MSGLSARQHYKLLFQIFLGLNLFLALGLVLIAIFEWGEIIPFIASLFIPDHSSYLTVVLLGLLAGIVIASIAIGIIILTKTTLPKTEGAEIIEKIMRTPSGIITSSLGGGFFEEFFFRGALIGLFIGNAFVRDHSY
jgi:membrane protease YdiL (CAAX protease family)